MARFIAFFVVFPLLDAVGCQRNDALNIGLLQKVKGAHFGIEGLIRQQGFCFFKNPKQENMRTLQIMRLSRQEMDACGIAQSIAGGVDLSGQSALAAPDRFLLADVLGLLIPLLRAPAAC